MKSAKQWIRWLLLFVLVRVVLNSANRMAYPFLREFQQGLGLSLVAITQALAWRSASLIVGPALAWVPERFGRRMGMLFGLGLLVGGMLLGFLWLSWWGFTLALILAAWAKVAFDASMQAFVGDRVPYARRGAVLAATEFSWSLSFFIGMPWIGWWMAHYGWRAAFGIWVGWGLLLGVLVWGVVPREGGGGLRGGSGVGWSNWLYALRHPSILQAIAFGLLATAANEVVGLFFGVWLGDAYGFTLTGLGLAAAVIGLAEFSGEGLTVLGVDRIGKRRAILIGLIGNIMAALLLPRLGQVGVVGALAGLFFFFLTFEILLVSSIPLMTEIWPQRRALTMGAFSGSVALGRALGAAVGPSFYAQGGVLSLTWVAVAFNLAAMLAIFRLHPQSKNTEGSGEAPYERI